MAKQVMDELFVQLSTQGIEKVTSALGQIQSGLQSVQGFIAKASGAFQVALTPVAALTAGLTAMTFAGLQGTVELEQFAFNFKLLAREIAGVFLPVIEFVTGALSRAWRVMSGFSATTQRFLMVMGVGLAGVTAGLTAMVTLLGAASMAVGILIAAASALAVAIGAVAGAVTAATGGLNLILALAASLVTVQAALYGLVAFGTTTTLITGVSGSFAALVAASKPLRDALWSVVEAMMRVASAAWPIVKAIGAVALAVANTFIVEPIIKFCHWLQVALVIVEKLAARIASMPIIRTLGSSLDGMAGGRTEPMLNQTGTESAQGTFARIQEAALRLGTEKTPLDKNTDALVALGAKIDAWIETFRGGAEKAADDVAGLATGAASIISPSVGFGVGSLIRRFAGGT